jgi:hypothetical protein
MYPNAFDKPQPKHFKPNKDLNKHGILISALQKLNRIIEVSS